MRWLLALLLTSPAVVLAAEPARAEPDPSITRVGDVYYLANGSALLRSKDLATWTPVPTKLPASLTPQLYVDEDKTLLVHTTGTLGREACVGLATADALEGPWKDRGNLVCTQKGVHFGSQEPFVLAERGVRYLVWKENGDAAGKKAWILFQALDQDAVKLKGDAHELVDNDTKWEGHVIDSPSMLRRDEWLYLFYAGEGGIGVARTPTINGGWKKPKTNPLVKDAKKPTVFTTTKNEVKLLYVTAEGATLADVTFDKEGWPKVQTKSAHPLRVYDPGSQPSGMTGENPHP